MTDVDHDLAAHRVGSLLRDKYRLEQLIGIGGMATVYRAVHRNGHRVAVKVLRPELGLSRELVSRFLKESYIANAVEHPATVRVLDDDVAEDGSVFLVMDLLHGESLADRRENQGGRLPAREVMQYAYDVADVLAAAHAKGIIHRDIKPANLFLTGDGEMRVLDFGIARMRDVRVGATVTQTGAMMGTPAFMPPEQVLGRMSEIDGRTDLWALGATMFTLLTGLFVHDADTPQAMMVASATRPVRSLRTVATDLPDALIAVIDRALSFERHHRQADARALQRELAEAYRSAFNEELVPAARSIGPFTVREPSLIPPVALPVMSTTCGVATGVPSQVSTLRPPSPGQGARRALIAAAAAGALIVWGLGAAVAIAECRPASSPVATQALTNHAAELPVATAVPTETPAIAIEPPAVDAGSNEKTVEAPPPAAPARPRSRAAKPTVSCDPPYVIDPVTHGRKVKPGC